MAGVVNQSATPPVTPDRGQQALYDQAHATIAMCQLQSEQDNSAYVRKEAVLRGQLDAAAEEARVKDHALRVANEEAARLKEQLDKQHNEHEVAIAAEREARELAARERDNIQTEHTDLSAKCEGLTQQISELKDEHRTQTNELQSITAECDRLKATKVMLSNKLNTKQGRIQELEEKDTQRTQERNEMIDDLAEIVAKDDDAATKEREAEEAEKDAETIRKNTLTKFQGIKRKRDEEDAAEQAREVRRRRGLRSSSVEPGQLREL
jgi:chromosome segregation ATPase